eukprot:Sspe_Gene.79271::Locus_49688_Transcript_2_3_Confidence_0.778_Length_603::g.79271::m.79271
MWFRRKAQRDMGQQCPRKGVDLQGELMLLNSPGWKEDTLERSLRKALAAYSEVLQDTCVNMLRHDPSARPSADDIEAMANLMVDGLRSKGFSPEAVVHYE